MRMGHKKRDSNCVVGVFYRGAVRAVHKARLNCGSKRQWLCTDAWKDVTCRRCLNLKKEPLNRPLPKGVHVVPYRPKKRYGG